MAEKGASTREGTQATNLTGSFGVAAVVVIAGVIGGWLALQQLGEEIELEAPATVPSVDRGGAAVLPGDSESLLERAELAFAAGRIVEPEFDSALGYYRAALEGDPESSEAAEGIERVVAYLLSRANSALYQNDWEGARDYAGAVLEVEPDNERAADVIERSERFEEVQALTEEALAQFSDGRLIVPDGDNAAETYRRILEMDPDNEAAQQGLDSVAQRLVANAQSATIAGEIERAQRFIEQARSLDDEATGLEDVERMIAETTGQAEDRRLERDLVAASEALQEDRLMPPAQPNAYELFSGVLEREPGSEAAQRGLRLVREALMDRAQARLGAGDLAATEEALADAERAGTDADEVEALREEIAHQERFADARLGSFERVYSLGELEVVERVSPEYPRLAMRRGMEGWAELEFTVTEDGEVRDPEVTGSSSSVFDQAAVAAIDEWRFEPVMENGRPIPVRAGLRFTFEGRR